MNIIKPLIRPRRLRQNASIRAMIQENQINKSDLVYPLFVTEGTNTKTPIVAMPNIYRYSIDLVVKKARELFDKGILGFALFPYNEVKNKDESGSDSTNPDNLINRAVRQIKSQLPNCVLFTDVALDPYTTHGHDGIIDKQGNVLNDQTIEILMQQAIQLAKSGADFVCPSDMMDGRVLNIRQALDTNGFEQTGIMSYAVKYASNFYGPFRDAVGSGDLLKGDKKTYQMNSANAIEAVLEASLDVEEGADILMIKPGMPYLDILAQTSKKFTTPVAVYQVSGEYAMIQNMLANNQMSESVIIESMLCFKRAGASIIFTYFAEKIVDLID